MTQGGCSRGRGWVHTLPFPSLQLTEAEAELASIELCGDQGWKRRLAKVRRRPRPADNYAKGCVCAGSSK